jgi:Fe-S cluster biogenesis protein NfuA
MSEANDWKQIESLVSQLESCEDPAVRDAARDLVGALLSIHGVALGGLLRQMNENMLEEVCKDSVISSVLLLHGLHPEETKTRVEQALEKVRPSLKSHQGDVELLEIDDARVRLRLIGTCNGCPSSATTFQSLLETAIRELAPEIECIEVDGMVGRAAS